MTALKNLLMIAAGAIGLALLYGAVPLVTGQQALGLEAVGWEAAVIFVMACALIYPVRRSRWHGWRLAIAVFVLAAGVSAILIPFEMLVFTEPDGLGVLVLWWFCRAAGLSAIVVLSQGRWQPRQSPPGDTRAPRFSVVGWIWRIAVGVISYTVLFMVAGLLIMRLQAVPDYTSPEYAAAPTSESAAADSPSSEPVAQGSTIRVPETPVIFSFIFIRGLACIAFSLPLVRSLSGGRWAAGLSVGLALAVLGGVAPLLTPNADMTTGARYGHMLEIGWSNFAYGLVIGWLFGNRKAAE